jgi:hypothetical protein
MQRHAIPAIRDHPKEIARIFPAPFRQPPNPFAIS